MLNECSFQLDFFNFRQRKYFEKQETNLWDSDYLNGTILGDVG
jgi:hypothetical protein